MPSGDNISNETGSNSFTVANKFEHSLKGTAQPINENYATYLLSYWAVMLQEGQKQLTEIN